MTHCSASCRATVVTPKDWLTSMTEYWQPARWATSASPEGFCWLKNLIPFSSTWNDLIGWKTSHKKNKGLWKKESFRIFFLIENKVSGSFLLKTLYIFVNATNSTLQWLWGGLCSQWLCWPKSLDVQTWTQWSHHRFGSPHWSEPTKGGPL